MTRDVDLTIVAGFGAEESIIDPLLERFDPRLDNARAFALQYRVLLLRATNTVPIDIALGALPFEQRAARRATRWAIQDDLAVLTCGPEDLVVHKVFAGRDQDWLGVAGVIERQGGALDRQLIKSELAPLLELKGTTPALTRIRAVRLRLTFPRAGCRVRRRPGRRCRQGPQHSLRRTIRASVSSCVPQLA